MSPNKVGWKPPGQYQYNGSAGQYDVYGQLAIVDETLDDEIENGREKDLYTGANKTKMV